MSETYSGKCVGGPYDGRVCTHFAKELAVTLGPEFDFMNAGKEEFEISVLEQGRYVFTNGIWWQWQT